MSLLILEDLRKLFGAQEVLSGASMRIDPGEKVGLVGRNGGGKTTLLRLIEGSEAPDWGRVILRKGADLGSVAQRPDFAPGESVRMHVESGLVHLKRLIEELERIGELLAHAQGEEALRLAKEHALLGERIEHLGGWELERRAETVLSGIGLAPALWEREARSLSGGEKSRTALARALAGGHDLLLLDEPTNHLDLEGIEWIEDYIRALPGSALIVSHDRRLLENAVDAIVELERGKLVRYNGNYSRYVEQKHERYESDLRAFEQQQDFLRKEQSFIKKHMGSQRTGEAKGRQKKLGNVELLPKPYLDVRRPVIRPPKVGRGGELVLEAEGLAAGFGERILFQDLDLRIGRGQRVGIVGRNGAGKTTLLRILAGRAQPRAGRVRHGQGSVCGYYDQETSELSPDGTPYSEIRRAAPALSDLEIRSHLANFLFRGDDEIEKPVAALSGGERARLALARFVLQKPTWLAMDEPTNHLDLAGRTALEEMLSSFEGALLFVSHDRAFLDDLCDHVLELGDGARARLFRGNYSAWRAAKAEEREAALEEGARKEAARKEAARKQAAKAPAASTQPAKGARNRNPYKLEKIERRIIELEEKLTALNAELGTEEVYRDPSRLRSTQVEIAEVERELAIANAEWESFA